jgi:hypothetical protein
MKGERPFERSEPDGRFIRANDDRVRQRKIFNGSQCDQRILAPVEYAVLDVNTSTVRPDRTLHG